MSYDPKGCSHGIAWDAYCIECEKIGMRQNLYDLSQDCKRAADQLTVQPGLCSDPRVVIDVYRTVDRLASILMKLK